MDYEHNNKEEDIEKLCVTTSKSKDILEPTIQGDKNKKVTTLFTHLKSSYVNKNEDELKVVIERDNMIVGFVDAPDSDISEESQSEDDSTFTKRKCLKRHRSKSPKFHKKVSI